MTTAPAGRRSATSRPCSGRRSSRASQVGTVAGIGHCTLISCLGWQAEPLSVRKRVPAHQLALAHAGTYVIGVQRVHTPDNPLVISKMLDAAGTRWSPPVNLTQGLSVVSGNTGIEVSAGRVLKTFEVNPSMAARPAQSPLTRNATLALPAHASLDAQWRPESLEVAVADASGFVEFTLVKVSRRHTLSMHVAKLAQELGAVLRALSLGCIFVKYSTTSAAPLPLLYSWTCRRRLTLHTSVWRRCFRSTTCCACACSASAWSGCPASCTSPRVLCCA